MPSLDVSELNVVIAILGTHSPRIPEKVYADEMTTGTFIVAYGFISVKIKQVWYLGEACTSSFYLYRANSAFPI